MKRRDLITSASAAAMLGAFGALPARAQDAATPPADVIGPILPAIVTIQPGIPAGEIHVDPNRFALYWTLPDGQAIRYAVGIGRPGLYESGRFQVGAKKEWPSWTPTPEMVQRQPELYAQHVDGMPGGIDNPLGARALYLFTPEQGDTFLRIHGTNAPETIGTAVSNGCARLVNEQIIALYENVAIGTTVILYPRSI